MHLLGHESENTIHNMRQLQNWLPVPITCENHKPLGVIDFDVAEPTTSTTVPTHHDMIASTGARLFLVGFRGPREDLTEKPKLLGGCGVRELVI